MFLIQHTGWDRRPACTVRALSKDLRDRLLNAVEDGMTCRAAATRFGVAPSTAICVLITSKLTTFPFVA
ncbi:hypothetical protein FJU08_20670 [Martelella alba]|uniref:Transposase n=1 Tax=Martelella alba TaxID=2590451 RepID=A0A506U5J2_9HYPH|nr:hypothetical protein FJU08_20670 [Martelella alba]